MPVLQQVTVRINFIKFDTGSSQRLQPEFVTSYPELSTYELLIDKVRHTNIELPDQPVMKAWLPEGLVQIRSQEEWEVAHLTCVMHDWMDRVLKVVVEV